MLKNWLFLSCCGLLLPLQALQRDSLNVPSQKVNLSLVPKKNAKPSPYKKKKIKIKTQHASKGMESWSQLHLDDYLSQMHASITEGYCTSAQAAIFRQRLKELPHIRKVIEIGFNAGYSTEIFLEASPHIEVVSFDINEHLYTRLGRLFMEKKYSKRFLFVEGDSARTLPEYSKSHSKVDLIYIDGGHSFASCFADIQNGQRLSDKNTLLWINSYNYEDVKNAVDFCVREGLIEIIDVKTASDPDYRCWVEAKYRYNSELEKIFSRMYHYGIRQESDKDLFFTKTLQSILHSHDEILTIVDMGCGNAILARELFSEFQEKRKYIGIDIVTDLIQKNQLHYGSNNISFVHQDYTENPLPQGDLLICKDLFNYLSYSDISKILSESNKFKYLLLSHEVQSSAKRKNFDIQTGGFRPLDMTLEPFHLQSKTISHYPLNQSLRQLIFITSAALPHS